MKIVNLFIVICLVNIYSLRAQNSKEAFEDAFDRAEKIFSKVYQEAKSESLTYSKEGYSAALPIFLYLYKHDPGNMNLTFKLGVCYLSSRKERAQAIPYFSKAVTAVSKDYKESSYKERSAPPIAYKFLGDAYHLNYQFDKAIEAYEKFIALVAENKNTNKALLPEANASI